MADFPGEYFKLINLHIIAKVDAILRPFGLTCAQSDVLLFLHSRGSQETTVQDIGAHFGLKHPTVVGTLHRLESKGFVRTAVSARDRRCRVVHLTEKFSEVYRVMDAARLDIDTRMARHFTDDEIEQLRVLLQRIYRNFDEA